jgi:hypothetical protein
VDPRRLLEELLAVARKVGVEVKTQHLRVPIRSAGGLCRLKGKHVILLDGRAEPLERAAALAEALGELKLNLDEIELTSEARSLILRRAALSPMGPRSARAAQPGLVKTRVRHRSRRRVVKS